MADTGDRSRWWSKARGMPRATYDSWAASMRLDPNRPVRVLAWVPLAGADPEAVCLGSPAVLSVGSPQEWRHVGWEQIEHGHWNAELRKLTWSTYEGRRGSATLPEPARMPELFRERIAASIAVQRFVSLAAVDTSDDAATSRGVTVTARRDLGATGQISWHATLSRGLSWQTESVRIPAEAALAELRMEYDRGGSGW